MGTGRHGDRTSFAAPLMGDDESDMVGDAKSIEAEIEQERLAKADAEWEEEELEDVDLSEPGSTASQELKPSPIATAVVRPSTSTTIQACEPPLLSETSDSTGDKKSLLTATFTPSDIPTVNNHSPTEENKTNSQPFTDTKAAIATPPEHKDNPIIGSSSSTTNGIHPSTANVMAGPATTKTPSPKRLTTSTLFQRIGGGTTPDLKATRPESEKSKEKKPHPDSCCSPVSNCLSSCISGMYNTLTKLITPAPKEPPRESNTLSL